MCATTVYDCMHVLHVAFTHRPIGPAEADEGKEAEAGENKKKRTQQADVCH